jgi:Reverse transcriptase (RNA-dependent DNA polymerase)
MRRSSRQTPPSTRLKEFITYSVQYPIQNYISYNNITNDHYIFLNSLSQIEERKVFEIIKLDTKWCKVMNEELHALEKNQTWKIYFLPKTKTDWLYKIKYRSDGTIERYKIRLVVKGYTQIYDIDCHEIFASIVKMNTVRILF